MQLNPGEQICDECKGCGYDLRPNHYLCAKCHGKGKLDWIEIVVGSKPDPYDSITIPTIRKMMPKLIASELINVQPMDGSNE